MAGEIAIRAYRLDQRHIEKLMLQAIALATDDAPSVA
jgi:hypothetical protein